MNVKLIRSFVYDTKRPVKQSMKRQVCSKLAYLPADVPPPVLTSRGQDCDFILADQVADLPPPIHQPVTGNFRFLLYQLFLADQVADLQADLPPVEHRSLEDPQSSIDPLNTTTPNQLLCNSSYWQIKWWIYPPPQLSIDPLNTATPKVADLPLCQSTIHPLNTTTQKWQIYPHRSTSGSEWQFKNFTVQAHSGRSTGRSTPPN